MEKQSIKFEIYQLRKVKFIYAIEACVKLLLPMFGFMFSNQYFLSGLRDTVNTIFLIVAVGYFLFMCGGNCYRWYRIKKLEEQLKH